MNLYEINKNIENILSKVDEETGELDENFAKELELLGLAKDEKIESLGCYIKNLSAFVEALKQEKLSIADRQAKAERKIERLKDYLVSNLQGEKFKTSKVEIGYRHSQKVAFTIPEEDLVEYYKDGNNEFLKTKYEFDKAKIKEALKNNEVVYGTELKENVCVQVK